jgi:hypothetical protein
MWCAGPACGAACRGAGAWALTRFEPVYIKLALGLFLTANLPLLFLRPRAKPQDEPAPIKPARLMALGAAVGLVSGFTGAVGVLFNRFYIRLRMQKAEIVATRAANELLLHALKIALYASFGLLTTRSMMAGDHRGGGGHGVMAGPPHAASCSRPRFPPCRNHGHGGGRRQHVGRRGARCAGASQCRGANHP